MKRQINPYLLCDYRDVPAGSAVWITHPQWGGGENVYLRFRRTFTLDRAPETAKLRISADSRYQLFLNGREVGVGPVRGTAKWIFYDLYDVAELLRTGENRIEILLHSMNMPNFLTIPVEPALWLELEHSLSTDERWEVAVDPQWRRDVLPHTFQTGYCQWRDYRRSPREFVHAVPLPAASPLLRRELTVRDVPALLETGCPVCDVTKIAAVPALRDAEDINIAEIQTAEPHSDASNRVENPAALLQASGTDSATMIHPAADGSGVTLVLNFGREILGRFFLDLEAPAGTIVDITVEEELFRDRRLRGKHLNPGGYNFTDRYICSDGRFTIDNSLHERGFRYIQVTFRNFAAPIRLHGIHAVDNHYPYHDRAAFFCSDLLLNRIWDVCVETLKECTADVFIDCPWRERAFWVNDLIVENKTSLVGFGGCDVHRRAFRLAFSQTHSDGLIDGVCPCSWKNGLSLVATNLFMPLMLADYLLYAGDGDTVRKYLPDVKRILATFDRWSDEKGIVRVPGGDEYKNTGIWNFIDWSYDQNGRVFEGKATSMLNLFYVLSLQTTIRLAGQLGDDDLPREKYRADAKKAWEAVFRYFTLPGTGYLADALDEHDVPIDWTSQLPHALAMLTGMASESELAICRKALHDPAVLQPEFYLHYFIFQALAANGEYADALNRIRRYWRETIMTGTPTLWESGIHHKGKQAFMESGSLCHGFGTSPMEFFSTVLLGVRPRKAGFAEFSFDPRCIDLEFAKGRVPTPAGNIDVEWSRGDGGKMAVELNIPEGLAALLPSGEKIGPGFHKILVQEARE